MQMVDTSMRRGRLSVTTAKCRVLVVHLFFAEERYVCDELITRSTRDVGSTHGKT
jgi:hypothetical protein